VRLARPHQGQAVSHARTLAGCASRPATRAVCRPAMVLGRRGAARVWRAHWRRQRLATAQGRGVVGSSIRTPPARAQAASLCIRSAPAMRAGRRGPARRRRPKQRSLQTAGIAAAAAAGGCPGSASGMRSGSCTRAPPRPSCASGRRAAAPRSRSGPRPALRQRPEGAMAQPALPRARTGPAHTCLRAEARAPGREAHRCAAAASRDDRVILYRWAHQYERDAAHRG